MLKEHRPPEHNQQGAFDNITIHLKETSNYPIVRYYNPNLGDKDTLVYSVTLLN